MIEEGRQRLLEESARNDVVLLTGRPERCRADTVAWLAANGMGTPTVLLRPDSDRRPAAVFKAGLIASIGAPEEVVVVIDDDDSVLGATRGDGIPHGGVSASATVSTPTSGRHHT